MNSIEERLWDYIDGNCSTAEREAIDLLLIESDEYRQKYLELLAFNREIAGIELEEPSMAFTYNVIEQIRTEHARQPLKAKVNQNIIKTIAGFFVMTLAALLIFTIVNINWKVTGTHVNSTPVKMPDIKNWLSGGILQAFLFLNTVLALFLLDGVLRKRIFTRQA